MLSAREGEVVDVGLPAEGPFVDVVDFGEVARHVAAWGGAATFLRVQHDPLIRGGDPFGAPEVKRSCGVLIEDTEVVVGVGRHPDEVTHRQQAAAAGDGHPGAGVQLLKSGRHDDGDGKPVVLAEIGVAELSAHQCREGVVLALRVGAGVVVLGGLAGFAGDSGGLVGGVAHAGGGEFGQPGFEHGP